MDVRRVEIKEIKEAGVIKATIRHCNYDAIHKINDNFMFTATSSLNVDSPFGFYNKSKYYMMPYSYSAIARCMPGDEYDFETGKRIAIKKLSEKYNKGIDKRVARFAKDMAKAVESANKYLENKKI